MRMSKGLTTKIAVLVAVVLASMIAMGVLLTGMQGQLTRSSYAEEIEYEEASLPELLEQADAETVENTAQFDAIYQSKAASVAFMAQNDACFEATDAKMAEYRELLAVDNVMVVTRTGEIVARAVAAGEVEQGILICGTGLGISLAANKVKGIRAAVCSEPFTAKMARAHNNCNILAFGARVVGPELAKMIVETWLDTDFEGGRHQRRVDLIMEIENKEQ